MEWGGGRGRYRKFKGKPSAILSTSGGIIKKSHREEIPSDSGRSYNQRIIHVNMGGALGCPPGGGRCLQLELRDVAPPLALTPVKLSWSERPA